MVKHSGMPTTNRSIEAAENYLDTKKPVLSKKTKSERRK
jgi:hypothetical protein